MKELLFVFGTRPEAIKMSPVVLAARLNPSFRVRVCVTGQHREMLDQVLSLFEIVPDFDLNVMSAGQTLNQITARVISGLSTIIRENHFDLVLVHGDTTTTMASSLTAFHHQIPVAHIESGLRTYNIKSPWPEEMNRRFVGMMSDFHFAPTETNKNNLLQERIPSDRITVTGNTVIDALKMTCARIDRDSSLRDGLERRFKFLKDPRPLILVTGHRRENMGEKFEDICRGLRRIATELNCQIVFPVHLNPNVQHPARTILGGIDNIHLLEPLEYVPFCFLMLRCYFVITDSGGIQEEAPALGKPVIVMRDTTERPEAVAAGTARLAGPSGENVYSLAKLLLTDRNLYLQMAQSSNPYGVGQASQKIVARLARHFGLPYQNSIE